GVNHPKPTRPSCRSPQPVPGPNRCETSVTAKQTPSPGSRTCTGGEKRHRKGDSRVHWVHDFFRFWSATFGTIFRRFGGHQKAEGTRAGGELRGLHGFARRRLDNGKMVREDRGRC